MNSIKDALARAIQKESEKLYTPKEYFRISSMGKCHRAQIAERAGMLPTVPPTDRARFLMWTGTVLHKEAQKLLISSGFMLPGYITINPDGTTTEKEVRYRSYLGHPDGATKINDALYIAELKTCDDDAIIKNGVERDWQEHYFWQGLAYALAENAVGVLFFQLGKAQGLSREKIVLVTQDWRDKINTEIAGIDKDWEQYKLTGCLPPCQHRFRWEDKLCSYRDSTPAKPTKPQDYNPFRATPQEQDLADWLDAPPGGDNGA